MGSSQPTAAIYNGNFKDKSWVIIGERTTDQLTEPILVKLSGQEVYAWEYLITLKPTDNFEQQSKIYYQRASSRSHNLVNILSAQHLNQKYEKTGECQILRVRSQRIVWTLNNSHSLKLQQCLYILQGVCKGFAQILDHFDSPFYVYPDMIGMNNLGTIRVWMNQNFARNDIISYKQKVPSIQTMQKIVLQLITQRYQSNIFPYQKQFLTCPNFSSMAIIASNFLIKLKVQNKKAIAKNIMQNAKISKMLTKHYKNKSKQKAQLPNKINYTARGRSRSIFDKRSDSVSQNESRQDHYHKAPSKLGGKTTKDNNPLSNIDNKIYFGLSRNQYINSSDLNINITERKHKSTNKQHNQSCMEVLLQPNQIHFKPQNKTMSHFKTQRRNLVMTDFQNRSMNLMPLSNNMNTIEVSSIRNRPLLSKRRFRNNEKMNPQNNPHIKFNQLA